MWTFVQTRKMPSAALFWPLLGVTTGFQVLDIVSIWIAGVGSHVRETNPVILTLEAHYGIMAASLVKALAIGAGLLLIAGFYLLALRLRSRLLSALCLVVIGVLAVYSAAILWNNIASLAGYRL